MPDTASAAGNRRRASAPRLEGALAFRTLPEQIAAQIRQAILTGRLRPGSRLVETDVAARMRTSRGPIRDALGLLDGEGLVVRLPHRGSCVLDFTHRSLREAASLRAVLEGFAAALAIRRLTKDQLGGLETLVRGMEEAARHHDLPGVNELDYQFHDAILEASRHQILHEAWRGMQRRTRAFLASTNRTNVNLQAVARRHRAILNALASRKVTATRRAIRAHFERLEHELEFFLAPRRGSESGARSGIRTGNGQWPDARSFGAGNGGSRRRSKGGGSKRERRHSGVPAHQKEERT